MVTVAEAVEPTGEYYSAEDMHEELVAPNVRLAEGSISAWDGDQLVGYLLVVPREAANPEHRMRIASLVHPEYRKTDVGARLIDWCAHAAVPLHEQAFPGASLELHARAYESQRWYAGVLNAGGFRRKRSFATMHADLGTLPRRPELPGDLRLVRFEDAYDDATRLAVNDTFAGHWGSTPYSPALWRHRTTGSPAFLPDLSFLLLAGDGEVSAFVLCAFYEGDTAVSGVREVLVSYVGTRAALRGRGIATALLGHTLIAARAHGYERAALGVDMDNANNALEIYRRCGFEVVNREHVYVRPVP
jgi:GNAT superfamily N-acetyltransferase